MVEFTYLEVEVDAGSDASLGGQNPAPSDPASDPGSGQVSLLETLAGQGWEIVSDNRPAEPRQLLMRKRV